MIGKFFNNKEKNMISSGDIKIGNIIDNKGKSIQTPVIIPYKDRFLHTLIVGPTGCGKSSQLIQPMINQDLQNKELGITLIEPKGDLSINIFMMAKHYNREVIYFNPALPDCPHINIFESNSEEVADLLISSFNSFLSKETDVEQELNKFLIKSSVNAVKKIYGVKATILELNNLINNVDNKGIEIANKLIEIGSSEEIRFGKWLLTDFLVNDERKEYKQKRYKELKEIINKIATDKYLERVLSLPENSNNVINFDEAMKTGKVLIFNTAHGSTRDLGYYLGQFIINKYSSSAFKIQDKKPNICYIDEFQVYQSDSFINLLTVSRSYNVSLNLAIQTNAQLENNENNFMNFVLSNTRNKIVFPGISNQDAIYYSELFTEISDNCFKKYNIKSSKINKEELTDEFKPVNLIYRPFGQATYSIINNNKIICPGVLKIEYIDKELNDIISNMINEWNSKYIG